MVLHAEKILFSLFLLLSIEATAQQPLFTNQQHFGVEDGLPQSFISGIVQDDDGFIWLSTMDGLCRYDGRGFITVNANSKDSNAISLNIINNIGTVQNNSITIFYNPVQADEFNLRTLKAHPDKTLEQLSNIPNARWHT